MFSFTKYTPHAGHVIVFLMLATIFGAIASIWKRGWVVFVVLFVVCVLLAIFISALMWFDKVNENWDAMRGAAEAFSKLDNYRFAMFGIKFPKIRAKFGGTENISPLLLFGDCEVAEVKHLAVFLERSTRDQVVPLRYWYGEAEFRQETFILKRDQWEDIVRELLDMRMIIPESSKGSHSYLWASSTTLYNLKRMWSDLLKDEKRVPQIVDIQTYKTER